MGFELALEWTAAGLGCAVADGLFHPLETLKVRQQATSRPLACLARGALSDGGVWRGLYAPAFAATIVRAFTYTGFRVGAYPAARGVYARALGSEGVAARVAAGLTTGAVAAALFNPIDLLRIQSQLEPARYPRYNVLKALVVLARNETIPGLWRASSVSILRSALLSASQLATYDTSKRWFKTRLGLQEGAPLHLLTSLLSGCVAQTVIQPVDTLKTMVLRRDRPAGSVVSIASGFVRKEGLAALYRGYLPALMRQGPVMLVQMPLTEQLRRLLGLGYF
ncbi:mitochondrial carrier domain-containing protein [Pelagophyceae sp. CCMP2097]|nr:mitochondrial carrier domain-containing protein [Pelagophyceae sp. CCMP2097]|mmetsp:Transcript_13335/g.46356  ORF Transcript_13335/g.46356 Transcript_13335/m.46356 type:complete len:280 (+) Transcript_13335:268-1107(+)